MNAGCPEALPPSDLNFDEVVLAVAYKRARCDGQMAPTETGFVWGEKGDCEKQALLKAARVFPREKADELQLIKLER